MTCCPRPLAWALAHLAATTRNVHRSESPASFFGRAPPCHALTPRRPALPHARGKRAYASPPICAYAAAEDATPSPPPPMTLGFFGGGMMAEAIVRGLLNKRAVPADRIVMVDVSPARLAVLSALGVHTTLDAREMLRNASVVVIAVKPDAVPGVLPQIAAHEAEARQQQHESPDDAPLFVSICAGLPLATFMGGNAARRCARVMPNTACAVGEAASAFTLGHKCTATDRAAVETVFGACGLLVEAPERLFDAVTALSGSGPATVYMLIEAMSDGGVRDGLPRQTARMLATQTVLGAAAMVLHNPDVHPAELRNRVESPGGTTIAASAALEDAGFRAAVLEAMAAAHDRSVEMHDADDD